LEPNFFDKYEDNFEKLSTLKTYFQKQPKAWAVVFWFKVIVIFWPNLVDTFGFFIDELQLLFFV